MRTLACVILCLAPASLLAQDASKYYPLKVGNTWSYKFSMNGQTLPLKTKIVAVEKVGGADLYHLEATIQGVPNTTTEDLEANAKGVFRHKYSGMESKPPVQLLRTPVKDGDTWKSDINIAGQAASLSAKVGREDVTVPAGKYKAVTVKIETDIMGQKIDTTYWFAEGVGIVKQVINLPNGAATMELEKFEPGK